MIRSIEARISDARDHAAMALELGPRIGRKTVPDDTPAYHALLFELMVIGEALNHVPQEIRAMAPAIKWRAIYGLRNHIVHGYWQVEFSIVAAVVEEELQALIDALDDLNAAVREQSRR